MQDGRVLFSIFLTCIAMMHTIRAKNVIAHMCKIDSDCKDMPGGQDICGEDEWCVPSVGPIAGHRRCGQCPLDQIGQDGFCEGNEGQLWTNKVCPEHTACKSFGRTGAGFCDDLRSDVFRAEGQRASLRGECRNPHHLQCVQRKAPYFPWSHHDEVYDIKTDQGEQLYLNFPTTATNNQAYAWSEGKDCADIICNDPDVSSRYKRDRFGGYLKAFGCANVCNLTCQVHHDAFNVETIGWTIGDAKNRTLLLDDTDVDEEEWWDPFCPDLICRIERLRYRWVRGAGEILYDAATCE
eukprot:g1010.t1